MKKILIALVAAISFSACSTEIEVNAEWKDVTVVFGLLDVSDTIQYIKISKAFLGEEDAFVMAQEPDSLYYSCLLYTSPSPRDRTRSRMPSSA